MLMFIHVRGLLLNLGILKWFSIVKDFRLNTQNNLRRDLAAFNDYFLSEIGIDPFFYFVNTKPLFITVYIQFTFYVHLFLQKFRKVHKSSRNFLYLNIRFFVKTNDSDIFKNWPVSKISFFCKQWFISKITYFKK